MKIQLAIMLCCAAQAYASPSFSQQTKHSVDYRNSTIVSVLDDLTAVTGYSFVYREGVIAEDTRVSLRMVDATIENILAEVLVKNGYGYSLEENVVVITHSAAAQQPQQAARQSVAGIVRDADGNPVAGATVAVKDTGRGTLTDAGGGFSIMVGRDETIVFSFVGKQTVEVRYTGQESISVRLEDTAANIEQVVVTGIFDKSREFYTGAAPTYNAKELREAGNVNLLKSIANLDPSFNVIQDMEYGSDPNRLPDITMRGRTSMGTDMRQLQEESGVQSTSNLPLFILDGFEISLQRVMDMNQEMVESVTLLKDAGATALYGARGANGIVVITSRRPEPGRMRIGYRGDLTAEVPDLSSYNMMDAREKLEYEKAAGLFSTTVDASFQGLQELYYRRLAEVERGVDTYWLKYPVRTGFGNRHSLTLDGGAENFRYSAGLGYNNVAGAMKESSRSTFTGNLFFQYELENVKFQNDLIIMSNRNYNSPYGSFSEYAAANPIYTPYNEDGSLKKIIAEPSSATGNSPLRAGNPLYNATLPYRDDGKYVNIQDNFAAEWYITPELFVRGRLGITWQNSRTDRYLSREHTSFDSDTYSGDNYKLRGSYTYGTGYDFALESDLTLNYNKTFAGRHQLYAGLSLSIGEEREETYTITGMGMSALNMANLGMAAMYPPDGKPASTEQRSRRAGSILNVNYTFDRRYFLDLSGKAEGSSKFGANRRMAIFWSAGAGWNMHHEPFMKNVKAVNTLRLRFSYGTSGSQEFNAYQALTTLRYFLSEGYKFWNGSYMIAMGNPDLTWQTTRQANMGVDATLLDGRVNLNVDLYDKLTDELLSDINLPTAGGFGSYKANVGEVRNRGLEVNANAFILRDGGGFSWSVGGSLAHNTNRILRISSSLEFLNDELVAESSYNPSFLYKEGESMNTIYAVRSLGIDPANGREIFLNKYGERTYEWNAEDQVPVGVNEPKVWGTLRTLLRWRNVSANAIFSYTLGGSVYNSTLAQKVENISTGQTGVNNPWNNVDRRALYDRWREPGDHALFKNIDLASGFSASNASSRFVMRDNTLRLSSVSVTYEFGREWLERNVGFLEYLNLSLHADDVIHLSTIKRERGTTYPFARQFSFSLSTRF